MDTFTSALAQKFKTVDVTCSCTNCNNKDCLGKQNNIAESCSCEECLEPQTCLFRGKRVKSATANKSQSKNLLVCVPSKCDCGPPKCDCGPPKPNSKQKCKSKQTNPATNIVTYPELQSPPTIKELNTANLYELCRKSRLPSVNKYVDRCTEPQVANAGCRIRKFRDVCNSSTTTATAICICPPEQTEQTKQSRPVSPANFHDPSEYILDTSQTKVQMNQKTCLPPAKSFCHRVETPYNNAFVVKKATDKQGPRDYLKGAAGYVFEVPKHNPRKKQQENLLNTSNKVEIPVNPYIVVKEPEKQDPPDYLKGAAGYVFEVPKSNEKMEPQTFFPVSSSSTVEVPQNNPYLEKKEVKQAPMDYLQGAAGCVIEIPKYFVGIKKEDSPDEREKRQRVSSLSGKKKRESDKQVFNVNRLETKRIACNTLHNFYKTNSSQCNDLAINKSELPEHDANLQQYKPTKNARELFKNILETQGNSIKILTNTIYQEKNSNCNVYTEILESQSSEYIYELPKCAHKFKTQRNSCEWREKSNSELGCLPELHAYTKFPHEPGNNSQVFGIFESKLMASISKNKLIKNTTCDSKEIAKRRIMSVESTNHRKSSKCLEPGRKKSIPQELSEYGDRKPQAHKVIMVYDCSCRDCLNEACEKNEPESSGKVLELPKIAHETPEIKDTQKSAVCCQSETKCIQSDTQNIEKNITGTQTNINDLCKEILSTQMDSIEVVKKVYLPEKSDTQSKHNQSSDYIVSKEMLQKQTNSIEVLKQIYLPQKYDALSTYDESLSRMPQNISATCICCTDQLATTSHNGSTLCCSPRTDFKVRDKTHDSLGCQQESNMSSKSKIISKFDIFMRLKEAYRACSCKICECVSGKSVKPEVCKCKSCDCVVCPSDLKRKNAKQEMCECKACDCERCSQSFAEQCNCEPCQCGDCKMKSTNQRQRQIFVVAPVGTEENAQGVTCTCSPCDCIECGLIYPLTASLMHEMSTSTARYSLCRCEICLNESCGQNGFDSCKCQKSNKLMRKPVEQDTHDYDIRTAMIARNKPVMYLHWRET